MNKAQDLKLLKLGPFSLSQAAEIGISQQALSRLVKSQKINHLERGIYIHPKAKVSPEIDFQIAYIKFGPRAVIGGLSALFHYNLLEQVPQQIWVLVPKQKRTHENQYRFLRTTTNLDTQTAVKSGYKIVTIERAVIEALKLAPKIGERVAIGAARNSIRMKQTTLTKLGKAAKELDLYPSFLRYYEAIVA